MRLDKIFNFQDFKRIKKIKKVKSPQQTDFLQKNVFFTKSEKKKKIQKYRHVVYLEYLKIFYTYKILFPPQTERGMGRSEFYNLL